MSKNRIEFWVEDNDKTALALFVTVPLSYERWWQQYKDVVGDASTVEVEADTVLESEESDDNPDEAEELRVDSDMEKDKDDYVKAKK